MTGALGLASFSLAGLYCNHADLSPRYAPFLLGLTNTSGAVPGIIGVVVTGAPCLHRTDDCQGLGACQKFPEPGHEGLGQHTLSVLLTLNFSV